MGYKIAIDIGTTNSVVTQWDESGEQARLVELKGMTAPALAGRPAVIPSLLYVHDGRSGHSTSGQAVVDQGLDRQQDNRLFRNFKRGLVTNLSSEPRPIDGEPWTDELAAQQFVRQLMQALPYEQTAVERLVLTAPVASFEGYLAWLAEAMGTLGTDNIHIVDESTAAALGYAVTEPGAVVLVFDFGGGTLDLSLVQLPESREKTGGFLKRLLSGGARQYKARVIAKAGRVIGGSDIDQWLLDYVLQQLKLDREALGSSYTELLTLCEQAKIALSSEETADLTFAINEKAYSLTVTRTELEHLLEENGFFQALRRVVDQVMQVARRQGIFKEDINYVLMVGGTSLTPSVQKVLGRYFTDMAVRADKPFTAVAEGALQVAAGFGLDDYLVHSYGLRHLDPETNTHHYDEIIAAGSRFPSENPVEVLLGAAHPNQETIEFVVGEIATDAVSFVEVVYEDGQAVFVAQTNQGEQQIVPLNAEGIEAPLAKLSPVGQPGEDRLKASFELDDQRHLRLTVTDLQSGQTLIDRTAVAALH